MNPTIWFKGDAGRVAVVLAVVGLLCCGAIVLLSNWTASRFAGLTFEADSRQRGLVLDEVAGDLLWRRHFDTAVTASQEIATGVRALLGDPAKLVEGLATVEKRGVFTEGLITSLGFGVFNPAGEAIAQRWITAPMEIPPTVRTGIFGRAGNERLKAIQFAWNTSEGRPVITIAVPVGGLRLAGYLLLHADPLPVLATLDRRLGAAVRLTRIDGGGVLSTLRNVPMPTDPATAPLSLRVRGPGNEPLLRADVFVDQADLARALTQVRMKGLIALGLIAVITGLVALTTTTLVLNKAERQRQKAEHAAAEAETHRAAAEHEQQLEHARAAEEKHAALLTMAETIEAETATVMERMRQRTAEMTSAATEMSALASRAGKSSGTAAMAAGEALRTAETVASAAEQLTASIREISGQVSQSAAVVGRAVTAGNETKATIDTLNRQVAEIGAVADLIAGIAAKTNLLALNATIEAARAGDAGKGFAVVAGEVKQLAIQTAHSTRDITRHISQVQTATTASVTAVSKIEETIAEINAISEAIAAAVEQQGAATAEIARSVAETARAANEMTDRTTDVSAEIQQTGHHADGVRENAARLDDAMTELRHSVVQSVRTATTEVDRRNSPRFVVDLPTKVTCDGRIFDGRIADMSDYGAQLRGVPGLPTGSRGTLAIAAVGFPLPFIVRHAEADIANVMFVLDAAMATTFSETVQRLARPRVA